MRLAGVTSGHTVHVIGLDGGAGMQGRLLALGLVKGAQIRIIANEGRGPLLVALGESRMTIGRGMAGKIVVQ